MNKDLHKIIRRKQHVSFTCSAIYAIIMYLDQYKCPRYKFFSFFTTLVSSLEEQDACTSPIC